MSDVDKIEERRGCEQDEELLESWTTKINKFFVDIQNIENSKLKETVTKMLTGKMMESNTEAFGKFIVSAPRSANADRKSNINSKKDHLTEHCSDSYLESTESNDSDESIKRTFKKEKTKKKRNLSKIRLVYPNIALKPIPFNIHDGKSFDEFLDDFETYAIESCGSDQRKWLLELNSFLLGSAKAAFKAINTGKLTYEQVTNKMKKWCQSKSRGLRDDGHMAFTKAKLKDGEPPYLFALKLESLIESVKLGSQCERDELLMQKFLSEVSKSLKKRIKERINYVNFIGSGNRKSEWEIVTEMLIEDESSDDDYNRSFRERPSTSLPVEVFMQQENRRESIQGKAKYSDVLKQAPVKMKRTEETTLMICSHCEKPGHGYDNCRRRLKLCLICGSNKHLMRECQDYKTRSDKVCHSCGAKGHFKQNCPNYGKESNKGKVDGRNYVTEDCLAKLSEDIVKRVVGQLQGMYCQEPRVSASHGDFRLIGRSQSTDVAQALNVNAPSYEGGTRSN